MQMRNKDVWPLLSEKGCPFGKPLREVVLCYGSWREKYGIEQAELVFQSCTDGDSQMSRMRHGLSLLTRRQVYMIARKHGQLCKVYVSEHWRDLTTMSGLFYWTGPEQVIVKILQAAWRNTYR